MKTLVITMFTILLTCSSAFAADPPPKRIAILPMIVTSSGYHSVYDEDVETVDKNIRQATHIPINSVLNWVEEIDTSLAINGFEKIYRSAACKSEFCFCDVLPELAKEINADVIILPVADHCYEDTWHSWWHWDEPILYSEAYLYIFVYTKEDNTVKEYHDSHFYRGPYNRFSTISVALDEMSFRLTKEAGLRELIHPIEYT